MRIVLALILCFLVVAVPSIWAYWVEDGVPICIETGNQTYPAGVSDGSGGMIVTWDDERGGNFDIYIQRVNALGVVLWTTDGIALSTASGDQENPAITSDGAGGAIVTWQDGRSGNSDIYAQRVNPTGTVQWTADGISICTSSGTQQSPTIASDGIGGAIITWGDSRSGNGDIYVQRLDALGVAQWTADGVALATATGNQGSPVIVSGGATGAIVSWSDYRSGNYDIYARRVDASGTVQWTADGVALCTEAAHQSVPEITSDGAAGAIVCWKDLRNGDANVYAQRVDTSGAVLWTADGIALCAAAGDQWSHEIISDDAGGAIVTWTDDRDSFWGIFAQRVNASGTVMWTAVGAPICTLMGYQFEPEITSDEAGGAIITWHDSRNAGNSDDIYAQRVDASGAVYWTVDGVAICAVAGYQRYAAIVSDGTSGAVIAWEDYRNGNKDIYAQAVDKYGLVGYNDPVILSIEDIPHDQGGWVRITIQKSELDDEMEQDYPISTYDVWQRVDDPALLSAIARAPLDDASGIPVRKVGGRSYVVARELIGAGLLPPGSWENLGKFAACQQDEYIYRASTLEDSTASGIPYSIYVVSAQTTTPSVWYVSAPDSGYSVDNLPPDTPEGLASEQSYSPEGLSLDWDVNEENDLAYYSVYRGTVEEFVPAPGNRIATPLAPEYFDGEWRWNSSYFYKISATDIHDNESGFALIRPADVTGTETPETPKAAYLTQNYPNPFNPITKIAFGLAEPGNASLKIFDASGRLARVLVDEIRPAARYEEIWDGRDDTGRKAASGVYFYRFKTGSFSETRKLILLR